VGCRVVLPGRSHMHVHKGKRKNKKLNRRTVFELILGRRTFVRHRVGEYYNPEYLLSTVKHRVGYMAAGEVGTLMAKTSTN
jgi:hypothetical protein